MSTKQMVKAGVGTLIATVSLLMMSSSFSYYWYHYHYNCNGRGYCTHYQSERFCRNGQCSYHWDRYHYYR